MTALFWERAPLAVQLDIESQLPRPINFQLAPDLNRSASLSTNSGFRWNSRPPAVPADQRPTLIVHQSFGGASGQPPTSLGAASDAPPADQLPTLVEHCCLRLHLRTNFQPFVVRCIFWLHLLANYRLSPAIGLPVCLWTRPPACTGHRILQLHLRTRSPTFIGTRILRLCLPIQRPTLHRNSRPSDFTFPSTANFRQPIDLPVLPSVTSGSHRRHIFGLYLRTQLPTLIGPCILRLCQRPTFDLDRSLNSSGGAVDLLPTCVGS